MKTVLYKSCLDTQEPGLLKLAVKRKPLKAECFDVAGSNRGLKKAFLLRAQFNFV